MRPGSAKLSDAVAVIAGPTASGKSDLALGIAEALNGVVINADSMQVYREMHVLTNRPDEAVLTRVPHRLFGVLSVWESCSVVRWREMAVAEIAAAHKAGRLPVVVGGTGLYLKALMEGLAPIPDVPPAASQAARAQLRKLGHVAFQAALLDRDVAAARLPVGDTQRLLRAWAVLEATGRPLSYWQAQPPAPLEGWRFHTVLLDPPRSCLYAACDARFLAMMEQGALDEVRAIEALALSDDLPALRALGVPALRNHLRGSIPLDDAVQQAQRATRNYAKRQKTWFRHQLTPDRLERAQLSQTVVHEICNEIRRFVLTERV